MSWQPKRDAKVAARDALIPADLRIPRDHALWNARKATASDIAVLERSGLLSADELRITAMSTVELAAEIRQGRLSAVQACKAFVKRAAYAHQLSNLLTEILFESALARAQELDAHFQSTGTTVGPLHGVPVSIKDNFNIAGVDSSVGFLSPPFAHAPAAADSLVVQILRNAGALILCKTNIPQLMMSLEPVNPLWGRSTNPHNRALITGGSSSGEGGLVASRGSVLGIGTDIGGSIRGPGAFNGVYALKPTSQRVPLLGAMTLIGGQESVRSVAGPLCSSVADIDLSMSVILAANPWESDPALLNVAWRRNMIEEPKGRKLRVGYFTNNGFYTTSPPVARAIGETVAALRAAGHECIEIQPPCVGELQAMSVQIFNSHGYIRLHEFIEKTGDPLEKFTAYQRSFATMSKSQLLQRAEKALKKYADDKVFQEQVLAGARGALSADEVYRLNIRRNEISKLWSDMWKEKNLDCVVCEVIALPAVPAGTFNEAAFAGTGTAIFNVLDYPGGTIPVTTVGPQDGPSPIATSGKWKGERDIHKLWNKHRETMQGAPVSIQVVGRRMEDEKVVGCMEVIDGCLKRFGGKGKM